MLQGLSFGVVVPALVRDAEDADNLARCLAALREHGPEHVVVVDDGSPTPLDPAGFRCVRQPNRGPAAARNAGFAALPAELDVVVFVDADIVIPPGTFARLAEGFARAPETAAIWGTVTAAHPHRGLVSRYKNLTHRHFTMKQGAETRHLTTMLAAIRRDAFLKVGGFDTRFRTVSVEDVELGRTLFQEGERVVLDTALEAEHRHRFTLLRAARNDFRKARAHALTTLERRAKGEASVATDGPGEARQLHYLVGVPLGVGALGALVLGRWRLALTLTGALALWERDLLGFLARTEGAGFAVLCLPLMVAERANVAAAITSAGVTHVLRTHGPRRDLRLPVRTSTKL